MWEIIVGFFSALIKPAIEYVKGRQELKKLVKEQEYEAKMAVFEAKKKLATTDQEALIAWELLSIQKNGWKDEYLTLLLSIPIIMCFIPGLASYALKGFEVLTTLPPWYMKCFLIVVASAFGYRKIIDFGGNKKNNALQTRFIEKLLDKKKT